MVAGLTVLDPGVLSLVQDTGRYGVGQLGLSQGGRSIATHLLGRIIYSITPQRRRLSR
jgi:hypothetical protein